MNMPLPDWLVHVITTAIGVGILWERLRSKVKYVSDELLEVRDSVVSDIRGVKQSIDGVKAHVELQGRDLVRMETELGSLKEEANRARAERHEIRDDVSRMKGRHDLTPPPWKLPGRKP